MVGKNVGFVCLFRVMKEMGRVKSGSEERKWTRMEREIEVGGGLVRRAVWTRLMACGRLFDKQRRGIKRLILFSSSSVRPPTIVHTRQQQEAADLGVSENNFHSLRTFNSKLPSTYANNVHVKSDLLDSRVEFVRLELLEILKL
ncbi:hypothetical protein ACET3Z_007845 [Daucus carota]